MTQKADKTYQIGIIVSRFNQSITQALQQAAQQHCQSQTSAHYDTDVIQVPGAMEIPFAAQLLAQKQHYDGLIILGAVIQGETAHFEHVCHQVNSGCREVMLSYQMPMGFGVLTTYTFEQAQARAGGNKGNMGQEAAQAVLEMIHLANHYKVPQ